MLGIDAPFPAHRVKIIAFQHIFGIFFAFSQQFRAASICCKWLKGGTRKLVRVEPALHLRQKGDAQNLAAASLDFSKSDGSYRRGRFMAMSVVPSPSGMGNPAGRETFSGGR